MRHACDFKSLDHTVYPALSYVAESTLFLRGRSSERHGTRVMAQSLVIGLLLVLAAVAGAVCVWLFVRGLSRSATAPQGAVSRSMQTAERVSPGAAAAEWHLDEVLPG